MTCMFKQIIFHIVLILTDGRSGSDLLQSLFDRHPQILQFPGTVKFDEKFIKIFKLKSAYEISKYFTTIFYNSFPNTQSFHLTYFQKYIHASILLL